MTRIVPLALALLTATAAHAETSRAAPYIEVSGEAPTEVAPDVATLSLGVATQRQRALDAAADNAKAVAAVISTLKAEGVASAGIQTTALTPSAVVDNPKTGAPKTMAYRAENDVAIEIRSVDRAGALIAKLIESGANTVEGVAFRIGDEGKLRDGLRSAAACATKPSNVLPWVSPASAGPRSPEGAAARLQAAWATSILSAAPDAPSQIPAGTAAHGSSRQ